MQIVYADVLFVVNFTMDFLSLYLTLRLLQKPLRPLPMMISAAIGGVWGIVALFLEDALLLQSILQLAIALLICYIPCRGGWRTTLGVTALFYGISCLMGGGMTALWTAFNRWNPAPPPSPSEGRMPPRLLIALALICFLAAVLLGRMARRHRMRREVSLTLTFHRHTLTIPAIADTGNLLTEPVSGLGVILIPAHVARRLLPGELSDPLLKRELAALTSLPAARDLHIRLIPGKTASGGMLLVAFKPHRCLLNGRETDAYVAVAPDDDLPFALVPSDSLTPCDSHPPKEAPQ